MKSIRSLLIGIVITGSLAASLHFLHAQETAMPVPSSTTVLATANLHWNSASDLHVLLQPIEMMPMVSAEAMLSFRISYSAQHSQGSSEPWPPLVSNFGLPACNLGDDIWLLADQQVMSQD